MSNEVAVIPANLPSYFSRMREMFPDLEQMNADAMNGVSAGTPPPPLPPSIGLNGTRFIVKENGEETTLNMLEMAVVILRAKPAMDKSWYVTKFTPGTLPGGPDCFSVDAASPDPSSPLKQHTSCAGCPQNQYGSGTDAQGNPSKGKACTDRKILALFTNNGVYKFAIPPASLKNFAGYIKTLTSRGVPVPTCITKIGFDSNFTYPVLSFAFGGMLDEAMFSQVAEKMRSSEVADIVGGRGTSTPPEPPLNVACSDDPFAFAVAGENAPSDTAKATKTKKEKVQSLKAEPAASKAVSDTPTDEELAAALGLFI